MLIDSVLVVTFAIGFPLIAGPIYLRRRAALRSGNSELKQREYRETIAWLTSMGVASLVVWVGSDRNLERLGLGYDGSLGFRLSLLIAVFLSAVLFYQVRRVRRDPATREAARAGLETVREYLPTTKSEAHLFRGVSFAAGIGEEIFYRGFLIWYFTQFTSIVYAVVVSSFLFGLAHAMHGVQSTVRATIMGFLLAGFYVYSGALWASMVVHTAVDLSSGEMGEAAFAE